MDAKLQKALFQADILYVDSRHDDCVVVDSFIPEVEDGYLRLNWVDSNGNFVQLHIPEKNLEVVELTAEGFVTKDEEGYEVVISPYKLKALY